jgi:hypothetical protein
MFTVNKVSGDEDGEAAHELLLPFVKIHICVWNILTRHEYILSDTLYLSGLVAEKL